MVGFEHFLYAWPAVTYVVQLDEVETLLQSDSFSVCRDNLDVLITDVTLHRDGLDPAEQPPWNETISHLNHTRLHLSSIMGMGNFWESQKQNCFQILNHITTI